MRIITLNVNGIRSAAQKGFFPWLAEQRADVVCLQEIKAHAADLVPEVLQPEGFHGYFHCAEKKGYSGVAIYAKRAPDCIVEGLGIPDIDAEGRFLRADFGPLSVISLYLPSGSSSEVRQAAKFSFMQRFLPLLEQLRAESRELILCGDWNIAHKEIDLRNWRSNQKNSGFLPEEREWLGGIFERVGFIDVFRKLNPDPDQYTWWSNRGQAWTKNVGWRIDYHVATSGIAQLATQASIYKTQRFSDHAPLTIDYDYSL